MNCELTLHGPPPTRAQHQIRDISAVEPAHVHGASWVQDRLLHVVRYSAAVNIRPEHAVVWKSWGHGDVYPIPDGNNLRGVAAHLSVLADGDEQPGLY